MTETTPVEGTMNMLQQPTAAEIAGAPEPSYNYAHLSPHIFLTDMKQTVIGGPEPGAPAPDFELSTTTGERIRLSALRGRPVVLVFGSVT